jgi:glucose-1-phosphate thymidylyltransferase
MKGIVLAGGKGSRLRPFTYSGAKQLVPIANIPVLHFPIRHLVAAGIEEIAIVVGETHEQVREAMGDGSAFGARFSYVPQDAPLGIAHAISLCREFAGSEPFVVYLGDNVLHRGSTRFVSDFAASGAAASVVLKQVDDPSAFGVARMDGERMTAIVEKPSVPPSHLAVTGVYAFTSAVFAVIAGQTASARGELEIADSINGLIAAGHRVDATITSDDWIDTGKMDDILAANRIVLAGLVGGAGPGMLAARGIDPGARLQDCQVIGPCVIGPGAVLRRCIIGPHVAIGADCRLEDVTIANAIVMERAHLANCPGIADSMIGRDAVVCGVPAGSRLTLGDHSRIEGLA